MKKQIFTIILLLMGGVSTFGQYQISATGANDMRLRTNNIDRLNILTNGNVGIGTATANVKLDIQGDVILKKTTISTVGTYNALDRQKTSSIYFNASGTVIINGIAGGVDGMILYLNSAL